MTQLFRRRCQLIVGLQAGGTDALDMSEFRIRFKINQAMIGKPGSAEIYIYNLSEKTMAKFVGEGQSVALYAGYEQNIGLIFFGQVFQIRRGRESPTDTYMFILAQTADTAHNYAVVSGTLAKGWTMEDQRRSALDAMAPYNVEAGALSVLPEVKMPRGKVLYGTSREYLDHIAQSANQEWGYDGNKVVMVDRNKPTDQLAFVLNTNTGMIGMPVLTSEGLRVTSLMNHRFKMGGQVQVDESSVQTQTFDITPQGMPNNAFIDPKQALGADGFYNIVSVEHRGDTRAQDWYTDLVCVGVNAIVPISGPMITAVQNGV